MAKNKHPMYGYTIDRDANPTLDDQSGEKFDEKGMRSNRAQMVIAREPDRKAMRYLGMEDESKMNLGEDFDVNKAGAGRAGRGSPGGPTAKELKKYQDKKGMKSGGKVSSASSRADGCAVKGKTKGRIV